ncbi:MAG: hypothetical protein WC678_00580 [Parcubacteria group bacterium]|jgi:hypothetical protein
MFSRKTLVADLLFWVQVVLAFLLSVPQFFRLLENVKGQSLSMQVVMLGFLLLNLSLALGAYRVEPNRNTLQIIAIYIMWAVFVTGNIVAIFWNGLYCWSSNDTVTMFLVGAGVVSILNICMIKGLGLKEASIKGSLAIIFKALPQFMMALKIASEGGAGIPMMTIIVGNIGVTIRIGQLLVAIKKIGWDKNLTWIFLAEVANEISWVIVTMAWFYWFLFL